MYYRHAFIESLKREMVKQKLIPFDKLNEYPCTYVLHFTP